MEKRESARQVRHRALDLIAAQPAIFGRQGALVATQGREKGRMFEPYYHLYFREGARQRSIYLGREGPVVDAVRAELARLHAIIAEQRDYDRQRKRLLRATRQAKAAMAAQLRLAGLRMKGFEVRGWRWARVAGRGGRDW